MDPEALYAEMVRRADNALAPESEYWERVERRRKLRWARKDARAEREGVQAENWREVKAEVEEFGRRLSEMGRPVEDPSGRIRF